MQSSRSRKSKRPFLDVNFRRNVSFLERRLLGLENRVLDLKPTFFKKYKIRWALAFLLVVFLVFAVNKLFTRAEVTDFYPQTCLGTWQNPTNSQGEPQNFNLASSSFSDSNSAVFNSVGDKIFCGKFLPDDYEAEGNVKSVGLTLVWNTEGAIATLPPPIEINSSSASSSQSSSSDSESSGGENNKKESFLQNFVMQAFAQELSSTVATPEPIQAPVVSTPVTTTSAPEAIGNLTTPESSTVSGSESQTTPKVDSGSPSSSSEPSGASSSGSGENSSSRPEASSTATVAPVLPDNNFLKISYSFDGQNWFELSRVSGDNWKNLTINLPNVSWADLRNLQISVEGIPTTLEKLPKVFLDGMLLEIQYDVPPIINLNPEDKKIDSSSSAKNENSKELPVINLPGEKRPVPADSESEDFTPSESPRFDFDLNNLPESTSSAPGANGISPPTSRLNDSEHSLRFRSAQENKIADRKNSKSFFSGILDFFGLGGKAVAQEALQVGDQVVSAQNPIVGQVTDPFGKSTDIQPLFLTVNNKLRISIPEPDRNFKPGRYRLNLWVYKNGVVYFTTNDFTWGVLAVNFNKSIFTKGDKARIGAGVLTDMGHTICNAELDLRVTDPNGNFYLFSTRDESVIRSETCGPETVTNEPDYVVEMKARLIGTYKVLVTAKTINGVRSIEDKFEVQAEPVFDVEREAPTRIFPPSNYKVTLHIKANQDFKGVATESMPDSFKLITEKISTEEVLGSDRLVRWNLDLKKGESQDLIYFFKAPEISPELYKIGPLSFTNDAVSGAGSLVFEEARNWQVAADAAGDVIILWDGANIPNGWTCLSCLATDIFFNVFPRASSTYGAASSSVNNASHTLTFSLDNGPSADTSPANTGGTTYANSTHTHTWGNGSSTEDNIQPLYRGLKFIKAATTTIPNGAIGMFDVSSSSLPSSWSYYSAIENRYLMGTSTIGNGGSSTHSHTLLAPITSGAAPSQEGTPLAKKAPVAINGHTHTIASSSAISADTNNPPYISVVFGQTTATTTLGSGSNGLIAMFDNTSLPANWSQVSTSGSAYAGRLILASSTFGATGGSSTHNHGGSVTLTSLGVVGGSSAANSPANINIPTVVHTHNVNYTVGSGNSMPVYRDVILGKYAAPVSLGVSNVVLNGGSAITLIANLTSTVSVAASTTGSNLNYATATISRSGVGFACVADNLNCYQIPSSSCVFSGTSPVSSTVTCSANIYYFAQATDPSSSFAAQNWLGQITLTDTTPTSTSSSTANGVELNTLVAINVTTSSVNYGSIAPSSTTGLVNQVVSVQDAGNASTSIQVSGTALTFGAYAIGTSTQHYASSTFNFGGNEGVLSDTATTISGITLNSRVSLVNDLGAWSTTTSAPNPAPEWDDGVAVAANGYMYLIGGEISTNLSTSSVHYSAISSNGALSAWTPTQALPTSTARHAAFAYNGKLYVLGGAGVLTPSPVVTSSVRYATLNSNGTIGSWVNTTALPAARSRHQSFAYNGYAYVLGGWDSAGSTTSSVLYAPIASNGTIGAWSSTTAIPGGGRNKLLGVTNKGFVYAIGGATAGANATTSVWYAPIGSDGTVGAWLAGTTLPGPIAGQVGFVNSDYVYSIGGSDGAAATTTVLYAVLNSDGSLGLWTNATSLLAVAERQQGAAYNGYAYSIGDVADNSSYYSQINSGNSQKDTFWGAGPQAVGAAPTGTYSGVNTFTASFAP